MQVCEVMHHEDDFKDYAANHHKDNFTRHIYTGVRQANDVYGVDSLQEMKLVYHIAVIDFLQIFDTSKRIEFLFKRLSKCQSKEKAMKISSVEANFYQKRFITSMKRDVIINQDKRLKKKQDEVT
jgi:hypothetical protein